MLFVSRRPCRDPRRVGNGVVNGLNTTSPKPGFFQSIPLRVVANVLDLALKSPPLQLCPQVHLIFVARSQSSPWCMVRYMGVCMYWPRPNSCVMLNAKGPSRSLSESPRARESAIDVLLESTKLVPPGTDTARLPAFATVYHSSHSLIQSLYVSPP